LPNAANVGSHRERPFVLIVDSNAGVVEEMAVALRATNHVVFTALTYEEGKTVWRNQLPDVLVVDIRLGQYNGLQLLIRAREDRLDVTAIVTSPVSDPVLEAETARFSAAYLVKPVSRRQLLSALQEPKTEQVLKSAAPVNRRRVGRRNRVMVDFIPKQREGDQRRGNRAVYRWLKRQTIDDQLGIGDRFSFQDFALIAVRVTDERTDAI
jgi:DNA-binding response OmpR family regulator